MARLTEEQQKRIFQRMKALNIKRPALAVRLGMSLNTLGTALRLKEDVHDNTVTRLIAFASGQDANDPIFELPAAARDQIGAYARASNASSSEWVEALVEWLQESPARVRQMVTDSVADKLVVKRLASAGRDVRHASSPRAGGGAHPGRLNDPASTY